jgi:hypothetical protein
LSIDLKIGRVAFGPVVTESPAYRVMEFERRFREAAAAGRSPDALDKYDPDDVARFWARTIPGVDGHVYWDGPQRFIRNDGMGRKPKRWVWERTHPPIKATYIVWATCEEKNCIAPDHLDCGPRDRRLYTDDRMLGALQVAAMRLGHTPTTTWWEEKKMRPSSGAYYLRWGSWTAAVVAAGLEPARLGRASIITNASCLTALRALASHVGRRPTRDDWDTEREWLRAEGHPTAHSTLQRRFGSWTAALKAAGFE